MKSGYYNLVFKVRFKSLGKEGLALGKSLVGQVHNVLTRGSGVCNPSTPKDNFWISDRYGANLG